MGGRTLAVLRDSMADCVLGYFAYCTNNANVSQNCATDFVPKCGRRNAEVQVTCMHWPGLG